MSAAAIFFTPYFCADYGAEIFRTMTVVTFPVVLVVFLLNLLWTFGRGDVSVSCDFKQNCILPCKFEAGSDAVIHWIQTSTGDTLVYSFYHNKDQLSLQADRFKGRTSLFTDQISRGNASLHLSRVEFQDTGTYKCYTSTISGNKESFINMIVDAPVQKVDIKKVEQKIICSSEGIYPKPTLNWSTSNPDLNLDPKTDIQPEGHLYNINSFLTLSENEIDYSCTISTQKSRRTATLFKPTFISDSESETTIPCSDSKAPVKSLVWKFNHNQLIVNKTEAGRPYTVSEAWRHYVKNVSETGALTLQKLSSDQKGMYMCELDNANETFKRTTILQSQGDYQHSDNNVGIAVGTVVGLLLVAALIIGLVKVIRTRSSRRSQGYSEPTSLTPPQHLTKDVFQETAQVDELLDGC